MSHCYYNICNEKDLLHPQSNTQSVVEENRMDP
jgi:hypothetical protein